MSDLVSVTADSEVPIWPHFVVHVLGVLSSGETLSRRDVVSRAADSAGISDVARAEMLDSGGRRADGRIGWALSHVSRAGWVERPSRANYRITPIGRHWLEHHPEGICDFSSANAVFAQFWAKSAPGKLSVPGLDEALVVEVDPIEQIESGINRIHSSVGDALLGRLRESHPDFFEQAVVDLLLKMGYGGAEQRGKRIGGSNDGGVDGVIDQDARGLDRIYVQAKRYADGNSVGREAIQAFVGALHGVGASRGVFITTSAFTSGACDYVKAVPSRVILIDGVRLVGLMVKYRVGVPVKQSYDIVELDEDFFE
jgi:restriction system protein